MGIRLKAVSFSDDFMSIVVENTNESWILLSCGRVYLSACASVRISLSGQIICLNSRNLKLLGTHDKLDLMYAQMACINTSKVKVMARLDIVDNKDIAPLSTNLAYKVKSKN